MECGLLPVDEAEQALDALQGRKYARQSPAQQHSYALLGSACVARLLQAC